MLCAAPLNPGLAAGRVAGVGVVLTVPVPSWLLPFLPGTAELRLDGGHPVTFGTGPMSLLASVAISCENIFVIWSTLDVRKSS